MTKGVKVLLGIATIWPILFIAGSLGYHLACLLLGQMSFFLKSLHLWGWLVPVTVVEYYVVLILCLRHVSKSAALSSEAKLVWRNWIILAGVATMPFYWHRQVWHDRTG